MFENDETTSTAPLTEGEVYDVKIEDVGKEGDGITRIEGFVVFVPNTNEGEEVKIKINAVRSKFAFAEVVEDEAEDIEE
ncbi:MAG: TRAM domain-containing protein [Methanobacteriaceae archaeon]|nr:TRAM domain-containing protein [Methanobacteriaceae archaeon]